MISAFDSGIECATEHELDVERPDVEAAAERHDFVTGMSGAPGSPRRLASSSAAVNGVA